VGHNKKLLRVVALSLVLTCAAVIRGVSIAQATQNPAGCSENDFTLQLNQDPGPPFTVGQEIKYTVLAGNTDASLAGCDISNVTIAITTPNGVTIDIGSGLNYPFPTGVAQVGGELSYFVNPADFIAGACGKVSKCPIVRAKSTANGVLHDNPDADDTFTVTKELSGPVVAPRTHYCPQGGGWTLQAVAPGNQYDKNADGFICTKDVPGKPGKGNTGSGLNNKDNNG
jgi:hypothetical protein